MNNVWAFGDLVESNDLLGEPNLLRHRMLTDGYLFFREVLRPGRVRTVHREMTKVLRHHGWLRRSSAAIRPVREGDEEYLRVYDDIQRLETFHSLAHSRPLMNVMRDVVGPSAFPHPLKVARLVFPNNWEISTPPHQDYPNNQGTALLTTAWVPLSDVPHSLGGLAVLPGSHLHGVQPLEFSLGSGNRRGSLSPELRKLHWLTAEYRVGDLLLFSSHTMHAALNNSTRDQMRLSVDFRFQPEREELTDLVLEPHFGRLSWEEIYEGWEGTAYQYYWKRKRFTVVPFDPNRFDNVTIADANVLEQKVYQHRLEERWADANPTARSRARKRELFDDIDGLGPTKRKRLVEELGGVSGVSTATREHLAELDWLGADVAEVVFERIQAHAELLATGPAEEADELEELEELAEVEAIDEAEPAEPAQPAESVIDLSEPALSESDLSESDLSEPDLSGIAGLGTKRRARLLDEVGGPAGLAELTEERLRTLTWLPDAVAQGVWERIHPPAAHQPTEVPA